MQLLLKPITEGNLFWCECICFVCTIQYNTTSITCKTPEIGVTVCVCVFNVCTFIWIYFTIAMQFYGILLQLFLVVICVVDMPSECV